LNSECRTPIYLQLLPNSIVVRVAGPTSIIFVATPGAPSDDWAFFRVSSPGLTTSLHSVFLELIRRLRLRSKVQESDRPPLSQPWTFIASAPTENVRGAKHAEESASGETNPIPFHIRMQVASVTDKKIGSSDFRTPV
jgi:hypothetical protein